MKKMKKTWAVPGLFMIKSLLQLQQNVLEGGSMKGPSITLTFFRTKTDVRQKLKKRS